MNSKQSPNREVKKKNEINNRKSSVWLRVQPLGNDLALWLASGANDFIA